MSKPRTVQHSLVSKHFRLQKDDTETISKLTVKPGKFTSGRKKTSGVWSYFGHLYRVDPSAGFFKKIRLAEPYFRLISGLAEFLRKLRNSAENTPEHHKFGQ